MEYSFQEEENSIRVFVLNCLNYFSGCGAGKYMNGTECIDCGIGTFHRDTTRIHCSGISSVLLLGF